MSDKRESGLEKLKRTAKDSGATGAWARTQLMGRDPEWMKANFPAHFPPVAVREVIVPVPADGPAPFVCDRGVEWLAYQLSKFVSAEWADIGAEGADQHEERIKGWLTQLSTLR